MSGKVFVRKRADSKIATALLDAVTTALLGKADASALASLLSTVDGLDTPLEVDTKIANALLGLALPGRNFVRKDFCQEAGSARKDFCQEAGLPGRNFVRKGFCQERALVC